MAYNSQNNDKKSTNTRSATLANGKPATTNPVLLMTSFWDDMLKLVFCQELPESQRTESKRFDTQNGIITCVSRDKCNELANLYNKFIKPMLLDDPNVAKEQKSYSVPIADINQLALGVDVDENGELHSYIELIKNIDPATLKSNNVIRFEFPMGEYIVDYKPESGEFGDRKLTHNGIDVFCKDLDDFRAASSKAYIHAARCVDKAYKDVISGGITAIGEKVGANMPSNGTGNSHYGKPGIQGSIFDQSNNAAMNLPTMSLDELESALNEAEGTAIVD